MQTREDFPSGKDWPESWRSKLQFWFNLRNSRSSGVVSKFTKGWWSTRLSAFQW